MATSWWEVLYTVITGGGRSAYVSGSGIKVVQAGSAAAAGNLVEQQVQGARIGTVNGPYATEADAEAQQQKDTAAQGAGTETTAGGTGTSNNPKTNVNIPNPLAALGSFFGDLGSRNLWLRVFKVIAGIGLVIIGVIQLTHLQNVAKTAVKGAVLA